MGAGRCRKKPSFSLDKSTPHTFTFQVAEGLSVTEVAPSREEIARCVGQVAAGRFRRPVLVLGIDGAYVPSRPESARGRRPGQARHRARRARWCHEWREAKGFRFSLLDGERIVHVLSWHKVQNEQELGEVLQQVNAAGLIPEDAVRLCVVCDGAEWIWKHVQAVLPHARQVLDYYHCAEYVHKVAKAQYGQTVQALEWVEATFTRLYMGKVGTVLGGLRRMQPASDEALKAMDNCWVFSTLIGAGRTTARCAVEAIRWEVAAWNQRTNASAMSGSSVRGRGGTRRIAIRCWRCAVRSITGPSSRCLDGINTRKHIRKNHLMLPD